MDDPQGPGSAIKIGPEAVAMQTTTTTTTPALSGNPKPLDLEPSSSPAAEREPALSDKPSPAVPAAARQELLEIDMEPVPEQHMRRQDTLDSLQSNFTNRRTNTIWSMVSTTSDITEVTEPDLATIHDEVEEQDASAPSRSFTLPCRSNTFQSPPPSRTPSFNIVNDEAMGPTRSNPHSDIRPLTHPEVLRLREMSSSSSRNTNPGRHGRGHSHPVSIPIRQKQGPESAGQPPRSSLGREDLSASAVPSDVSHHETSEAAGVELSTHSHSEPEWAHEDPEDWAMDALQRPDENLIQDVCDRILKQVFGVELHDLVDSGAAPEAYRSVSYCLDELSRITSASHVASFSPPIHELARGSGEQGHAPILPAQGGSDQNGQGSSGSGRRPNKRGPSDNGDSPDQDDSNDGDGIGGGAGGQGGKRPRTDNEDQRLSCPFRKRNPVKFNVRDHQSCAVQSFPDVSQLKRHVKIFHKQKAVSAFDCPRCKRNMGAKEALLKHLAVDNDNICTFQETPSSQNPEDGINAKIEDLLNGRRANSKVDTWDILWQTLFPDDPREAIPDPGFVPPVELDEVYDFHAHRYREELRRRICEEELSAAGSDQDVDDHVDKMFEICEEYIEEVFRACRECKIGNLPSQARRKRVQKPRAARGQKDPARLDIPTTTAGQPGFAGTTDDPGSASSMDTPRSNQSSPWAGYSTQAGMSTTPLAHVSPVNPFLGAFDVSGIDVSGTSSQVVMNQPEQPLFGYASQPQPHHHRKPSEDSGVGLERTMAFGSQRFAAHTQMPHGQMPYQNTNFMAQGMQANGRGHGHAHGHAQFPISVPMTIQTSMPLTMAGTASTGMDSTLLGNYPSPLDQGYGYSPDGSLGNMGNGNHM
ncbi:hypothetical protein B0T16DRAFT_453575 [Cercophora newfieldiana]|uniref:C2H2-type domain-containing protein n=1 Tax=Cercophora newfieldiana TaxID=92897 RepID=A0AA39YFT0_9PEZI|nr:hypothetical protein B0T16DRAFT_453575 [Cercophora newfieldiana]